MRIPCRDIRPGMRVEWGPQVMTVASIVWVNSSGGLMTFTNGHTTSVATVGSITLAD